MTYEQQNESIRKEIKDIDQQIENIQRIYSEVLFKADQFYSRSKAQWAMSEKLKSLECRREFLLEKLKESPEQRKKSQILKRIFGMAFGKLLRLCLICSILVGMYI